jgi:hypothetical protein
MVRPRRREAGVGLRPGLRDGGEQGQQRHEDCEAAHEDLLGADATGVWALRPRVLVRVAEGGTVVRRIPVAADSLPIVAADAGKLWLVRGSSGLRSRLLRLDPATGEQTGSLDLGSHQPQALVPSPRGLWVVCADGVALLVR